MVWNTIKAVYGYKVNINNLRKNLTEDGFLDRSAFEELFENIPSDLAPERISKLNSMPESNNDLILVYPPGMNDDGIAVGRRPITNTLKDKFVNAWHASDTIEENFDYSIPEFEHYKDRNNLHHYKLFHYFSCCSDSASKYVIIGVTYDEVDRNLFLDEKFDSVCDKVFNVPTKIDDIDDDFFQYDCKEYKSDKTARYGSHNATIQSNPTLRKTELLNPNTTIVSYVNNLRTLYPNLEEPACYLMLDDCTFCT